jgi:Kef-type K+ transport system membrane component KefB
MIEFLNGFFNNYFQNMPLLIQLALTIIVAAVVAFIIRIFKQPLIPAYIITGILMGPLFFDLIKDPEIISMLSEIGVAFLIFTAGLEIKLKKLKEVGKVSIIGGILQILILFAIAFFVALWLGHSGRAPIYIGLVVAFSSTMIVVKLLSDRKEINSLHGRIIIGILLVQDVAAIISLVLLTGDMSFNGFLMDLFKAFIFAIFTFIISLIINPLFRFAAKNQELLLLSSIALLFLFSVVSIFAKLSLVIGAFFAGVCLANSDYKTEIQGKTTPLRDFFSVIFFIALGMQLDFKSFQIELLILLFSCLVLVLIVKPFITMYLVRLSGYKKITSFLTGNALAQTSEFSLIIVIFGLGSGQISQGLFTTLVLLTILTMTITNYFINYEKKLFNLFSWQLNLLNKMESKKEELEYHINNGERKIILLGCHRMGSLFLREFEKEKKDILVVDYNPEIIKSLIDKKIPCIYGDVTNEEIIEKININSTEIIISTIEDIEDNLLLVKKAKKINPKVLFFSVAIRISEAESLYNAGADYVILPQVVGGQSGYDIINKIEKKELDINDLKKEHLKYLESIHNILY